MSSELRRRRRLLRSRRGVAPAILLVALLALVPVVVTAGLITAVRPTGTPAPSENVPPISAHIVIAYMACNPPVFAGCLVWNFFSTAEGGIPPYVFAWNFGDGSPPAIGQNVTHTFLQCGHYNVTVWAGNLGGSGSDSMNLFLCLFPG